MTTSSTITVQIQPKTTKSHMTHSMTIVTAMNETHSYLSEKYQNQELVPTGTRLFTISDRNFRKITPQKFKEIIQQRNSDYFIERGMKYLYQFMLYDTNH